MGRLGKGWNQVLLERALLLETRQVIDEVNGPIVAFRLRSVKVAGEQCLHDLDIKS